MQLTVFVPVLQVLVGYIGLSLHYSLKTNTALLAPLGF